MLYLIKRKTLREVRNIFTFAIINIIIFFLLSEVLILKAGHLREARRPRRTLT